MVNLVIYSRLMRKVWKSDLPEVLVSSVADGSVILIRSLRKEGLIRPLLPRVYTSNLTDTDQAIVKRNLWLLIGDLYPKSIISHRSAIELQPSPSGTVYLSGSRRRVYRWPGVTLNYTDGPPPQDDDHPIASGLHVSSLERACLENLSPTRSRGAEGRALPQQKIEERLYQYLRIHGEDRLNAFRDRARQLAELFDWQKGFVKLDAIISALLSTRPANHLISPLARAKAFGRPYDAGRLEVFNRLIGELRRTDFTPLAAKTQTDTAYTNFAFYESYFSNYIEGTTFRVSEAREIIFEQKIIPGQQEDSHDVLGTYEICGNRDRMNEVPETLEDLLRILKQRHRILLRARPAKLPGQFKVNANRAGNTFFVPPEEVVGTLEKGFEMMQLLTAATARALYIMFLIAEVHPFEDGNGRIARLMMNAELSSAGQSKIIIPTVYREDYLLNLRRLTRRQDGSAFVRMMNRARAFSHWLDPADLNGLERQLEAAGAFRDDGGVLRF